MHLNGKKNRKCHLMAKDLLGISKINGQKIDVYENILGPEVVCHCPGYIHMYDHNIQTSSSLKPLGQSKPNFT